MINIHLKSIGRDRQTTSDSSYYASGEVLGFKGIDCINKAVAFLNQWALLVRAQMIQKNLSSPVVEQKRQIQK